MSWTNHVDDCDDAVDRVHFESDTARAVLPVSTTLAVLCAGFALVHHVVLGQDPGPLVGVVAAASALVAAVVAVASRRDRIPARRAHAVMALLVAMTAVDAALHLAITGDPQGTVSFFILLVALAATADPATGRANRRGLALLSDELIELSRRRGEIVHCTFLDVDGLKTINDEQGHDAGDRVILAVAQAIRGTCRSGDVVARWGGDEFVVVGVGPSEAAGELEARVVAHLGTHHPADATLTNLSISVGRAELAPWDEGDSESLLWRADHDMYLRRSEQATGNRRALLPEAAVRWPEG